MPFLELSLQCPRAQQPRYERALEDVGALAVTLLDADAETDDEHAILEPGVGETPLWDGVALRALFPEDADALLLLAALEAFDPGLDWRGVGFAKVDDQDWTRAWMDRFRPMRFGARTWIVPWDQPLPEAAAADTCVRSGAAAAEAPAPPAIVRLDPGLAFGSGTHPTTALCLRWLDTLAGEGLLEGARVLDYGSGSGILAVAALKLGAAHADAVDNDPQALDATRDNAARNQVGDRLAAWLPEQAPARSYRIVVANILAAALDALAATLAARVAPGGRIALSGILAGQEDALLQRYGAWFDGLSVAAEDGWVRIDGVRRP
jgi:ribosomal protein L11 methyltransferase